MVRILQSIANIPSYSNVVVTGTKEVLLKHASEKSWLFQVLSTNPKIIDTPVAKIARVESSTSLSASLIHEIVDRISPGTDEGASSEFWFSTNDQRVVRVALCALPTAVSRHNIKSRPHAITKFIKSHQGKKDLSTLVVILADIDDVYSSGCAVARAASMYSRKNGSATGVPNDNTKEGDMLNIIFQHMSSDMFSLLQNTCNGIQLAARLVDAPANELHTDAFVDEANEVAARLKTKITIIQGKDLEAGGFGGLYGVGKASLHSPALVILSYFPNNATETTEGSIVFAGKGIVYDTGGLSIKSKDGMPGMKRDMGGAAAVLGAFSSIVESGTFSKPLHAILCIAENAVSEVATRPDDIHIMFSGKTVEINNTDAEGRLVLGDGVAYAVKCLNPEIVIDIATLTGAQGISTGKYFAALYCNNDELEKVAIQAGRISGDLVHPMPYAPEFFRPEFKSSIADMKNSVKDRSNAQVSCAGQFIGNHLGEFEEKGKWLHVDMASPAYSKADERATGFGVALLCSILQELEKTN